MPEEQELRQQLGDAVKMMRENAEHMKTQAEKHGHIESLVKEQDEKWQAKIDQLESEIKRVETEKARPTIGADGQPVDEAKIEHRKAFEAFVRKGTEVNLRELEQKALSVQSDPDGGYFVDADTSGRIATLMYETSPVRQYAFSQTIGTDALEGSADIDEASAGWVEETGSRTATGTPQTRRWRIPAHEIYAMPEATQKLLDDANVNVEEWLASKVSDKMARMQNTAFVNGDGVGKPRGFLTYADGTSWEQIEQVDSGTNGTVVEDTLLDLVYALKPVYRQGAAFFMNRSLVAAVRKITMDGTYAWAPGLQAGQPSTLFGYPVAEFEDMPDAATGSLSIAFGNLNTAYTIVDRAGTRVLRDPYTNKPYVRFYTTQRVGGAVTNYEALKIYNLAA